MNCDNKESAIGPRCRCKARVKITYRRGRIFAHNAVKEFTAVKCWQHYVQLEERARHNSATFRILKAEVLP